MHLISLIVNYLYRQANSKNCGPPPGNKFDLGTAWYQWKGLVTRIMHAKYQCYIINTSEDMSQVKVFVTDGRTDGWTDRGTDGRMRFNVPTLSRKAGDKNMGNRFIFFRKLDQMYKPPQAKRTLLHISFVQFLPHNSCRSARVCAPLFAEASGRPSWFPQLLRFRL